MFVAAGGRAARRGLPGITELESASCADLLPSVATVQISGLRLDFTGIVIHDVVG